ncbi:MAG: RCC1 domain-containing protein [Sandaracinaceae bacterium]
MSTSQVAIGSPGAALSAVLLTLLLGGCGESFDLRVRARIGYEPSAFSAVRVEVRDTESDLRWSVDRSFEGDEDFSRDVEVALLPELVAGVYEIETSLLLGERAVAVDRRLLALESTTVLFVPFVATAPRVDPIVRVSAGGDFTCAVHEQGELECWGDNTLGQLGDGTRTSRAQARPVAAISDVTSVVAMERHACALRENGLVVCWGDNEDGQLGSPAGSPEVVPQPVRGLAAVVEIAGGGAHTCARSEAGLVFCWGQNAAGQLGEIGTRSRSTPRPVESVEGATALACGGAFCCAVVVDGGVRCWGDGTRGQLGDGAGVNATEAVEVTGLREAVSVAAGNAHACARLEDGSSRCWGANGFGQLGDGTEEDRTTPVRADLSGVVALDAGFAHTCARTEDDRVFCFGRGDAGQRLDGDLSPAAPPTPVEGGPFLGVATGGAHTCLLTSDDRQVLCGGARSRGQTGGERPTYQDTPVQVEGIADAESVAVGVNHACVLQDARVSCWGADASGIFATPSDHRVREQPLPVDIEAIDSGAFHMCARGGAGEIVCWGFNGFGALGNGTTASSEPVVQAGRNATRVVAGDMLTCALELDSAVHCWGRNLFGGVGNGSFDLSAAPSFTGLAGIGNLDITWQSVFAWSGAMVSVWGRGDAGQTGQESSFGDATPLPLTLALPAEVEQAAGGPRHSCLRLADGSVHCAGDNTDGQLGDRIGLSRSAFEPVADLDGVVSLAAGGRHTCALRDDGTVRCWGAGEHGQLGDGTTSAAFAPVDVRGLQDVSGIAAADDTTCAVSNGSVFCWGADRFGLRADGASVVGLEVVPVRGL